MLVDHDLSGVIVGQTLATRPEEIYRALIEATAFGTKTVVDAFTTAGIVVEEFVAAGGLIKNELLMQIYADVLDLPITVITSDQAPALGSAIHAAVAAGAYPDVAAAARRMGRSEKAKFKPIAGNVEIYRELYQEYTRLHDYFGRGDNEVMHRLRRLRRDAVARRHGH